MYGTSLSREQFPCTAFISAWKSTSGTASLSARNGTSYTASSLPRNQNSIFYRTNTPCITFSYWERKSTGNFISWDDTVHQVQHFLCTRNSAPCIAFPSTRNSTSCTAWEQYAMCKHPSILVAELFAASFTAQGEYCHDQHYSPTNSMTCSVPLPRKANNVQHSYLLGMFCTPYKS